MRAMTIIWVLLLAGCAHLNYPGGPQDVARHNQLIQAKTESLRQQTEAAAKRDVERRSERDVAERQAIEDYKARHAEQEEMAAKQKEESQKRLESFAEEVAAEEAAMSEERKTVLELNQKYAKDIEAYIKHQLNQTGIKTWCKFSGNGSETDMVGCAVAAFDSNTAGAAALHDLQGVAYTLAVNLMRKYPVNYSITAQTLDDIPLAYFMYYPRFDRLERVITWY